jgi:hypothetical protein
MGSIDVEAANCSKFCSLSERARMDKVEVKTFGISTIPFLENAAGA